VPARTLATLVGQAGQQPRHPLALEAAFERPDRVGVRPRFLRPLGRGPRRKEDQRANQLIAPLHLIDKTQL
jgi:hypothetical protein